ncbi:MAG: hypothetical protein R3C49_11045 [Planctomycetaceae bacterium]
MSRCRLLIVPVLLLNCRIPAYGQDNSTFGPNGTFESDADDDHWPDGWATAQDAAWIEEQSNHFLRLTSPAADRMVMLYQEINLPDGLQAIQLTWKQRITNLKVGKNSWFDARIMLEFLDADRQKVVPTPSAPATRNDTDGWEEKRTQFLVPEGARILKFMPCLFRVNSGTFDLDDVSLQAIDPEPLKVAAREAAEQRLQKLTADAAKRRARAAAVLNKEGSLLTNGDFEAEGKQPGWPDQWGRPKSGEWGQESGNRFLRLTAAKPGELVSVYRTVDIPEGTQALELSWRQRISGLKKGEHPWHDARIMLDCLGIDGKKLKQPSPPYAQKDTDGWVKNQHSFSFLKAR